MSLRKRQEAEAAAKAVEAKKANEARSFLDETAKESPEVEGENQGSDEAATSTEAPSIEGDQAGEQAKSEEEPVKYPAPYADSEVPGKYRKFQ